MKLPSAIGSPSQIGTLMWIRGDFLTEVLCDLAVAQPPLCLKKDDTFHLFPVKKERLGRNFLFYVHDKMSRSNINFDVLRRFHN